MYTLSYAKFRTHRRVMGRTDEGGNEQVNYQDRDLRDRQHLFQPAGNSSSKHVCVKRRKRKAEMPRRREEGPTSLCVRQTHHVHLLLKTNFIQCKLGLNKLKLNADDDEATIRKKIMTDRDRW